MNITKAFSIFRSQSNLMKQLLLSALLLSLLFLSACHLFYSDRVKGNGNSRSEQRNLGTAKKIKAQGSMDVEISQGPSSIRVEADENILPYIITKMDNGYLVIKQKNNSSITSENPIKVYVTTEELEDVFVSGSGSVVGIGKFTGSNRMHLKVSGSGNIDLTVNTPEMDADISGSGTITLAGETRNADFSISGVGDCNADGLQSENVKVKVSGSGNAKVFAGATLDVRVSGVGNVSYKGSPSVTQKVSGMGEVKRM